MNQVNMITINAIKSNKQHVVFKQNPKLSQSKSRLKYYGK